MLKVFLTGAVLPLIFMLGWYGCRSFGVHWPNSLNIPGFFILAGSYPWSWPAMEYQIELNRLIGQEPRKLIQGATMIFGFALNVALVVGAFRFMRRITIASRRTR